MNRDDMLFKSQYILESLALTDPGFTFNLAHDNENNVTGIVWLTSYMHDKFERFDNYLSIDIMHSSICNAKEFYYIAPVIKNEIGIMNIVCEGFTNIPSYWNHCLRCVIYGVTLGIYNIFRRIHEKNPYFIRWSCTKLSFFYHLHLKMNLEKLLLSK